MSQTKNMEETELQKNCEHKKVIQTGLWDGKDKQGNPTGGPMAKCCDCGKKLFLTWEEWGKIPEQNRKSLMSRPKLRDNLF